MYRCIACYQQVAGIDEEVRHLLKLEGPASTAVIVPVDP